MSKVEKKEFKNYLAEARSWETDKVVQLKESMKKAWIVAGLSGLVALISVVTVAILGPQKTVVPFLVRVDSATGNMDVVSTVKDAQTTYGEVLNKYNLQWYVRWREGYSRNTITEYYNNVGYMSVPAVQRQYGMQINKRNPKSPLHLGNAQIDVTVKSITFVKPGVAIVRFVKEYKGRGSRRSKPLQHWLATISFLYTDTPQSEKTRAINPLGFQVVEYRLDADQTIGENTAITTQLNTPSSSQLIPPAQVESTEVAEDVAPVAPAQKIQ